ncbi:MAG: hypothetical protein ACKPJJ_12520, partial [Planctomycetaceae bacterium]
MAGRPWARQTAELLLDSHGTFLVLPQLLRCREAIRRQLEHQRAVSLAGQTHPQRSWQAEMPEHQRRCPSDRCPPFQSTPPIRQHALVREELQGKTRQTVAQMCPQPIPVPPALHWAASALPQVQPVL